MALRTGLSAPETIMFLPPTQGRLFQYDGTTWPRRYER